MTRHGWIPQGSINEVNRNVLFFNTPVMEAAHPHGGVAVPDSADKQNTEQQ